MRRDFGVTISIALFVVACGAAGCHRSSNEDQTAGASSYRPESTPATQFERDLKYERDAHFKHLWLFSRKDGQPITKDDSAILRTNAPRVVDWVLTDEGRKVLAGSNFDIEPSNMAELQKRFTVEDYSGK